MIVESALKAILENGQIPTDLTLTYDDFHGLWGGAAINICGSGRGERREWLGGAGPQVFETLITHGQLIELVRLLIKHEAWEQTTPARMPVPDEARATLTILVGGEKSCVWEWFNEMEKNGRLTHIRKKLRELTGATS